MGLDNKELKQAKKAKDRIFFNLKEIANLREELLSEGNERKKKKIQDKIQLRKGIITDYSKELSEIGLSLEEFSYELNDVQKNILNDIFPYGLGVDTIGAQGKRNEIIEGYRRRISKLKKLRLEYPPYDPSLPVKEKLKNKIYNYEKEIGFRLRVGSLSEQSTYDPEWNYKEHFETSTEFTQEEREILQHCAKIGMEYDAYFDEKYGFISEIGKSISGKGEAIKEWSKDSMAKRWARNLRTKTCPMLIKNMNPGIKLSEQEMDAEAKEMSKRFIQFIGDREELERCLFLWNELKKDEKLNGYDENKKNFLVFSSLMGELGEEKAWFTYGYTLIPETEEGIELLLEYTFEELGLE